jgi:ribonuclease Z
VASHPGSQSRIVVLGSGPALASATRDNTFFLFESEGNSLLIDCAGSPFHKLLRVGAEPDRLGGVLLTHAHPDHIYGLPSLIHEMWLWGRREVLRIYASEHTRLLALSLVDVFQLRSKPVPLEFHTISEEPDSLLLRCGGFEVRTSPVRHEIPTHAVRITSLADGKAVAFSADTSPCPELVALARGADLIFHECAVEEPHPFHSTPEDVGRVASLAEVARVVLVHCHHNLARQPQLALARIAKLFPGEVSFAQDFDVYDF